jgi:hypothetical protein
MRASTSLLVALFSFFFAALAVPLVNNAEGSSVNHGVACESHFCAFCDYCLILPFISY